MNIQGDMTLKEALDLMKQSTTPGALYRGSYVYYDDERNLYGYITDIEVQRDTWWMSWEQLDRLVTYAENKVWQPTSNLVLE